MRRNFYEETWFALLICGFVLVGIFIFIAGASLEDEVAEETQIDYTTTEIEKPSGSDANKNNALLKKMDNLDSEQDMEQARKSVNDFMQAYLRRNRQGVIANSFFEGRIYSRDTVYDTMDANIEMLQNALKLYKQMSGLDAEIFWRTSIKKVDGNICQANVVLQVSEDKVEISPIAVKKLGGKWLVDAESFTTAVGFAFVNSL